MKIYTKESLINELRSIRQRGWILSGRHGNDGAVGQHLSRKDTTGDTYHADR